MLIVQICGKMIGQELDSLTKSDGYSQIIEKPTHIVNHSMSYIYLVFCSTVKPVLMTTFLK